MTTPELSFWLPVLIVSGFSREVSAAVDIMKDGASDLIQKPFRSPEVSVRLQATLEASGRVTHDRCGEKPSHQTADVRDRAALEQDVLLLFDRFRNPLLRYVCACGIAAGDGEDVVQDVFLSLFRHLQRGGSRSNLQGWLFRVAHNLALKRRARQRREATRVQAWLPPALDAIDPDPNPELRLVGRERRHRLHSVLNVLPERERQCLHLCHDGLRYRDIARVLGISLGAVAKLLARAIGRLERADQR